MATLNETSNDVGDLNQVREDITGSSHFPNPDETYNCEARFLLSISDFVEQDTVRRLTGNVRSR